MSEFFARLGTSVTQYRPHAAIVKMLDGEDEDNDLADFEDDPEFRALVSKAP